MDLLEEILDATVHVQSILSQISGIQMKWISSQNLKNNKLYHTFALKSYQFKDPFSEKIQSNDIAVDLVEGVKQNQQRIQNLITTGEVPDELLENMLNLNDTIVRVLSKFEDLCKGKPIQKKNHMQAKSPQTMPKLTDLLDTATGSYLLKLREIL